MKSVHLVLKGFLIGMIFEYTLRVKVNPFAIIVGVMTLIDVVLVLIKKNRL